MTNARSTSFRFLLPLAFVVFLPVVAAAQSPEPVAVAYTVTPDKNPSTHILHISLQFNATASTTDVAMPAWSPGAYNIHNAWRNVQEFAASDETGAALKSERSTSRPGASTGRVATESPQATNSTSAASMMNCATSQGRASSCTSWASRLIRLPAQFQ